MPRIQPDAKEILAGDHDGVRVVLDDGEPLVTLAGRNMIADPLFEDFDMGGRLKNWTLGAPDRPDGYHVYMRQLTRLQAGGYVNLHNTTLQRQNTYKYPFGKNHHLQDTPLIEGPGIPDANKRARIPGPDRAPRVVVEERDTVVGLRAGRYRISYIWILGSPAHSRRYTNPAPAVTEDVAQGRWLRVFLEELAVPEGVSGLAIVMSYNGGLWRIQERINVRNSVPAYKNVTEFRQTRDPIGANRTYVGSIGDYPGPRVWYPHVSKGRVLRGGTYRLSYRLVTSSASEGESAGESASQQITEVRRLMPKAKGRGLSFAPPKHVLAKEGVIGWYPEIQGSDGQWYVLKRGGARPWMGINGRATVYHLPGSNAENRLWGWATAEQSARKLEDTSGIPGPDSALSTPGELGLERLPPGNYSARTTFAIGDEESAPSPPQTFTLRDAGGGVSDQVIRVYSPVEQSIPNDRYADKRPDGLDLDWETPPVPDVLVESGDGVLRVTDTSLSTNDATVRISGRFPLEQTVSVLKMRIKHFGDFYEGGSWAALLTFHDEDGEQTGVATRVLSQFQSAQDFVLRKTIGPHGTNAQIKMPPEATQAYIALRHYGHRLTEEGTTPSQRWLQYEIRDVGLFRGSAPNKRYPVDFGLYSDGDIPDRLSPDIERPELPYPPGAYCRVVEHPIDPADTPSTEIISVFGFEGGPGQTKTGWWHNGTITEEAALRGRYGLHCARGERTSYDTPATDRLAARTIFVPIGLGPDGVATMATINGTDGPLAQMLLRPNGSLNLWVKDGASTKSSNALLGVQPHSEVQVEIVASGANSTSGRARAIVILDGVRYPDVTFENLDWSGQWIESSDSGPISAPAGFEAYVDHVFITEDGITDTDPLPGNFCEFWSPPSTPYSRDNFMRGYKQPITEGQYTVSAHLGSQNITKEAELLPTVVLDEQGNVLQDNGPLASLVGDNDWERHHLTFDAPEGAAYIEFIGGLVADGLIRAQAPQLEEGSLSNFEWRYPSEGYFLSTLDTALPGGNPRPELESARSFEALDAVTTNEESTSVTLSIRAGDTLDEMDDAIWRDSLADLLAHEGVKRFVQVHCLLSTLDLQQSPGVRSLFLDCKRSYPMLLRADGSEFLSACEAPMYSAPQPLRNLVTREYADGRTGVEDIGRSDPMPKLEGLALRCYRESAAREIAWLQGYDNGLFILETPKDEKAIRFSGASFELENPKLKDPPGEPESEDGFFLLTADVESAEIVYEGDSGE